LFTAYHLKVKAIAALTESGSTALWMSRHKIHTPIFALTKSVTTQRAMAMYRNVTPIQIDVSADRDIALREVEQVLLDKGVIQSGDMVALTVGEPMGQAGGTNTLKIIKVK
jgi:pyruvate kinase